MLNNILFSIIIPTFNSERYIRGCLESILSQTIQNFEIIICDNMSSDQTLHIVTSFNDNRITILSEPDDGIYDGMNKGIMNAQGRHLQAFEDICLISLIIPFVTNSDIYEGCQD